MKIGITAIGIANLPFKRSQKDTAEFEFFPNDTQAAFPTTAARMRVYKEHALKLAIADFGFDIVY